VSEVTHKDRLAILEWLLELVNAQEGKSDETDLKVDAARLWLGALIETSERHS